MSGGGLGRLNRSRRATFLQATREMLTTDPAIVRLMPPLTALDDDVAAFATAFTQALDTVAAGLPA